MAMVCGLDLHRRQITFDALEVDSGKEWRGRIWQPDRERFRRWLRNDLIRRAEGGSVALAVEGCTGWRYVVEEIEAAGFEAHLAEPADTQVARGRKHRAKTDRSDARLLRDLLAAGELPASWIPPEGVLEWRERVRLYMSLVNQRTVWCQRIHAELYQHGVAVPEGAIRTATTRSMLADGDLALSPAGRQRITVGYRMIDATDAEAQPLKKEGTAALRGPPAGVSSLGRRPVRHRRVNRGRGVVRTGRLPALLALRASRTPHRPGRLRRLVRSAARGRVPVPARPPDAAVGAVRGGQELIAPAQPRPRLLRRGQGPPRRQDRRHLRGPQAGPALLPRATRGPSRPGLRHPGLTLTASRDVGNVHLNIRVTRGQLLQPACPPAPVLDGLQTLTRPRSHPRGTPDHDCCRRRPALRRAPR